MKAKYILMSIFFIYLSENTFAQANADFFYEVSGGEFLNVNFTDISQASETIISWQWEFGDENTSDTQNPIHNYTTAGEYRVVLFITTENLEDSIVHYVSVGSEYYQGDTCLASFSYQEFGNEGLGFNFFNESYTPGEIPDEFLWNFGDGTSSTDENPSHIYASEGDYTVSLNIISGNCDNTYTTFIYAGTNNWYPNECQALFWFSTNPANYKEYLFNDLSYGNDEILLWHWDFGDGTISNQANPIHEFATDGTYNTSLTITTENCENTFPLDITVSEENQYSDTLMPLFYPEVNNDNVIFHNLTIGDIDSWEWNFGDGITSTLYSPEHSFDEPGIHEVSLSTYSGSYINTIVIEFETTALKKQKSSKGINHAYFYPGGINKINTINTMLFSIYPNPANDKLIISSKNKDLKIQLINITGKQLFYNIEINKEINISNLPKGLYLIKVSNNKISKTLKFIKR